MEDDRAVQLTLTIDSENEPISGWLENPLGVRQPFVGMLDLIGLLERARAGVDWDDRAD